MTLPKNTVKPEYNFTHPSERQYYDETGGTLGSERAADPTKSGVDYGITDPQVTQPIAGAGSETGNGGGAE